ncbi:hypothetical protein RRF57_001164 [Xylaria bambusicola]|uniref:Uncharacterized protein n=1 Tax=Xylaria bambusicola TaxID=326684 RepID=A0AAN7Z399_9PEZI
MAQGQLPSLKNTPCGLLGIITRVLGPEYTVRTWRFVAIRPVWFGPNMKCCALHKRQCPLRSCGGLKPFSQFQRSLLKCANVDGLGGFNVPEIAACYCFTS